MPDNAIAQLELDCTPINNTLLKYEEEVQFFQGNTNTLAISRMHRTVGNTIIFYNGEHHQFDRFELEHGKLIQQIALEEEGPNGVKEVIDFYWHNADSIFILSPAKIILLNDKGKSSKSYLLDYQTSQGYAADIFADPTLGLRMDYLPHRKEIQYYLVFIGKKVKEDFNKKFLGNFDLESEKLRIQYANFPEIYLQNQHFSLFDNPSKINVGKKTILSFGVDPRLFVYDNENGAFQEAYCAKSKFIPNKIEGISYGQQDLQDMTNFTTSSGWYLKVIYDPYRNCYYRFVKHPQPLKNEEGKLNRRFNGSWSVLVFDHNFNRIGEFELDGSKYNMLISFVGPKGLYLPALAQESEEKIRYYVLDVKI